MKSLKITFSVMSIALLSLCFVVTSFGQIPGWYKGKPFKGKPQVIPGRIEFENHDEGGFDVGFNTDYIAAGPIKDYRPGETEYVSIDQTNIGEIDQHAKKENVDRRPDGSLYPSNENPHSYYVGWTHAGDWTRFTVHVTKSDDYYISSTFAEETPQIGFILKFNDDSTKTRNVVLDYGKGDWHTWKKFDNFATVHLDSGLYVMQFEMTITHLNYDYLEFTPMIHQ
jgi:hypothetical protein